MEVAKDRWVHFRFLCPQAQVFHAVLEKMISPICESQSSSVFLVLQEKVTDLPFESLNTSPTASLLKALTDPSTFNLYCPQVGCNQQMLELSLPFTPPSLIFVVRGAIVDSLYT